MTNSGNPKGRNQYSEDDEPIKAIYHHCVDVYNAMFAEAKPITIENATLDDVDGLSDSKKDSMMVYEGHLTKLFQRLGLSVPYYTSVMKTLQRMDCVRQIRRGGGNAKSQWELITDPTEETFQAFGERKNRRPTSKTAMLEQQVRGLVERVNQHEQRIDKIETRSA